MGMKNFTLKALVLAASFAAGASAYASSTLRFDPSGLPTNTNDVSFNTFDQLPGNALAIGAGAGSAVGTQFNLKYQSNLGSVLDVNGNPVFTNGNTVAGAARTFTFVAGFREVVTGNTINPATGVGTLTFGFADTPALSGTNFFRMYATPTFGNNLAGTGFTTGTAILTGHFVAAGYSSSFTASGFGGALDQNGGNNYPGVNTILGNGATVATLVIDSFDANYFPDMVLGATSSLINTSQNLAFAQVDPSAAFSSNGIANGDQAGVSTVGALNGTGANTMFQADANQSFTVAAVPEPESVALIGLGMLGLALARRRSKKA